jgi:hypothetical protein
MNVMANQTTESLKELKFYAVPSSWFVRAYPFLTARPDTINDPVILAAGGDNWKDHIGMIENSVLVVDNSVSSSTERTVSDDENDTSTNATQHHRQQHLVAKAKIEELHRRRMQQNGQHNNNDNATTATTKMKPGLVHTKDYFFLGPSAWTLVKEKFGFDEYEICRSCWKAAPAAATSTTSVQSDDHPTSTINNNIGQGAIAILLLPGEATTGNRMIEIPPVGRFPYEKIIPKLMSNNNGNHDQQREAQPEEDNNDHAKSNVVRKVWSRTENVVVYFFNGIRYQLTLILIFLLLLHSGFLGR